MALSNLNKDNINRLMESLALDQIQLQSNIEHTKSTSSSYAKLSIIFDQIKILHNMANDIIQHSELNNTLHSADCKFQKTPGNTYHFYTKDNSLYCSLLSPDDWRGKPPHTHFGSFLLQHDFLFYKI